MAVVTKTTQFQFLTKQVADIKVVNTALSEKVAKAESDISTLSGNIATASEAIQNLNAGKLAMGEYTKADGSLLSITVESDVAEAISDIDAALASVDSELDTVSTNVSNEVTRAKAAEEANAGAIAAEKTRAEDAEKNISDSVSAMDTAYKAADTELSGRITTAQADIDAAEDEIIAIKAQLGDGSGEGNSLVARVADLEKATEVEKSKAVPILEAVYSLTTDEKFVEGKTYYTRTEDVVTGGFVFTEAEVIVGADVAASTYFEKEAVYFITTDTIFVEGKDYYTRALEDDVYVYSKADIAVGGTVPTDTETKYFEKETVRLINDDYMPELKFQGQSVGKLAKSINIIGVGDVSIDDFGNITLRLGENLNSSSFNTEDSKSVSNGKVSSSGYSKNTKTVYATGQQQSIWLKSTNTVTLTTSGEVHFDDKTSYLILTAGGQTFTFGPIIPDGTSNTYYDAAETNKNTTGAKAYVSLSGAGVEGNSSKGATGYSAKVTFKINVHNLGLSEGSVSFSAKHVKSDKSTIIGTAYSLADYFYFIPDTNTKPTASNAVVSLSDIKAKTLSGVTYIISATVNYSANVADVGKPATQNQSNSNVEFSANNWANNQTATVAYNATSASIISTLVDGKYAAADTTVSVTPNNINGPALSTGIATAKFGTALLVNSVAYADDTNADSVEIFKTEKNRFKNDCVTAWQSDKKLTETGWTEGLMVANGTLLYPVESFDGYNEGLTAKGVNNNNASSTVIAAGSQPDYSGCTNERSYVRKFTKAGSWDSAVITLEHTASISSFIDATSATKKMVIEVSKDGSKWYNVNTSGAASDTVIGTARNLGTSSSSFTFQFTDGKASGFVWFKIRMASSEVTAVITKASMV